MTTDDDGGRRRWTTTTTLADGYEKNDEDDNDDDGPRRRRSRRRSRTIMGRRVMMISLLRGASTAKQSPGLSRAEPNSQERARAPPEAGVHSREACVQGPERQVCTGWTTSSCPAHGPCECPHDNACGWRWGGPHRRTFIPNRGTSSRGPDTTYHGVCIFWLVGPFYFWLGPYLLLAGGVLLLAGAFLRRGPLRGLWGFSGPLLLGRKLAVC